MRAVDQRPGPGLTRFRPPGPKGQDMEKETKKTSEEESIPWHIAFFEAIRMELDEYSQDLQFTSEYPLNTKPLQIDVVIIKKSRDVVIEKNIASIFRKENIIEYKSPQDYVSIGDFYKVYGYACVYIALNKVDVKDLTLTFVESHYPRELLAHLQEVRGYTVEERLSGIYIIRGDILPIQIIDSRKLSEDENIWLKDLYNKLEPAEKRRLTTEIYRLGKDKADRMKAYLYVIKRANLKSLREVGEMFDIDLAWDKLLVESGDAARWEARGEEKGRQEGREEGREEVARNALAEGVPIELIKKISGLDDEALKHIQAE